MLFRSQLAKIKGGDPHSIDAADDPLLERIEALLEDRVLPPPSAAKVRKRIRRFVEYRLPYQVPPGYADAARKSPVHAAGDYLLWAEILSLAKREDRSVLLVSDDRKGDWVQKGSMGHPDQPRPELLAEFKERTTTAFYHQMTLKTFLAKANEFLGVAVSEEVLREEDDALEADLAAARARGERGVRIAVGPGLEGVAAWSEILARQNRNMVSLFEPSLLEQIKKVPAVFAPESFSVQIPNFGVDFPPQLLEFLKGDFGVGSMFDGMPKGRSEERRVGKECPV